MGSNMSGLQNAFRNHCAISAAHNTFRPSHQELLAPTGRLLAIENFNGKEKDYVEALPFFRVAVGPYPVTKFLPLS
jgi:hypothetical protein